MESAGGARAALDRGPLPYKAGRQARSSAGRESMQIYAIALGSNRRHGRHGAPGKVIRAAMAALAEAKVRPLACSPIVATPPMGPSARRFANAAMLVESALAPPALLAVLKAIERRFGRRRGRRWSARVLDLDILLWSGGAWAARALMIPHPGLAQRRFVLDPLVTVAPGWRTPHGLTIRQLRGRLTKAAPAPSSAGGRVRSSVGRASDF